jgi:hypothetical protein
MSFHGKRAMSSAANGLHTAPRGDFFVFHNMAPARRSAQAAREAHMPIRLVVENSYLATDAGILIDAFEAALKELGLSDRNDTAALVVAKHLISFAKAGVLDPVQLRDLTVKAVRERPSPAN